MYWLGIDVGNSRTKYFLIKDGILLPKEFAFKEIPWHKIEKAAMVRTGNIPENLQKRLSEIDFPLIKVNSDIQLPFINHYRSTTLGADRIAVVSGAVDLFNGNMLIIDAGSCVTYDFLDANRHYFGGAISPGIRMRYQALHQFTSDLPLLNIPSAKPPLQGKNTEEAIHSGIINGILKEIEGITEEYRVHYPDLKIILTGGDADFLSVSLKIKIFAIQKYLLARGLKKILQLN